MELGDNLADFSDVTAAREELQGRRHSHVPLHHFLDELRINACDRIWSMGQNVDAALDCNLYTLKIGRVSEDKLLAVMTGLRRSRRNLKWHMSDVVRREG